MKLSDVIAAPGSSSSLTLAACYYRALSTSAGRQMFLTGSKLVSKDAVCTSFGDVTQSASSLKQHYGLSCSLSVRPVADRAHVWLPTLNKVGCNHKQHHLFMFISVSVVKQLRVPGG